MEVLPENGDETGTNGSGVLRITWQKSGNETERAVADSHE